MRETGRELQRDRQSDLDRKRDKERRERQAAMRETKNETQRCEREREREWTIQTGASQAAFHRKQLHTQGPTTPGKATPLEASTRPALGAARGCLGCRRRHRLGSPTPAAGTRWLLCAPPKHPPRENRVSNEQAGATRCGGDRPGPRQQKSHGCRGAPGPLSNFSSARPGPAPASNGEQHTHRKSPERGRLGTPHTQARPAGRPWSSRRERSGHHTGRGHWRVQRPFSSTGRARRRRM